MEALNNYIVVRKDGAEKSASSLIILPPSDATAPPFTGVIESVGSEVRGDYKVGDRIAYCDLCSPYILDDEKGTVLIITEDDIVAKLNE